MVDNKKKILLFAILGGIAFFLFAFKKQEETVVQPATSIPQPVKLPSGVPITQEEKAIIDQQEAKLPLVQAVNKMVDSLVTLGDTSQIQAGLTANPVTKDIVINDKTLFQNIASSGLTIDSVKTLVKTAGGLAGVTTAEINASMDAYYKAHPNEIDPRIKPVDPAKWVNIEGMSQVTAIPVPVKQQSAVVTGIATKPVILTAGEIKTAYKVSQTAAAKAANYSNLY